MRRTDSQLRRLVIAEVRRVLREGPKGNPQSEPEFGALLDALGALQAKGFSPDDVMKTALELSPRRRGS